MPLRRRLKPSLLMTEKDDMLFALDVDTGRVHEFNLTAKVIVQLFLDPRDETEAAAEYARTFRISPQQALEDVRFMLERFESNGLLGASGEAE